MMQKGQIYQNFSIKEYTDMPSKLAQIVTSTGKELKGQYGNDYHVMIHQVIQMNMVGNAYTAIVNFEKK